MRKTLATLAVLALFGLASASHASPLYPIVAGSYSFSGVAADGYSVTGSVTISSAGLVTAASFTFLDDDGDSNDTTYPVFSSVSNNKFNGIDVATVTGSSGEMVLVFDQNTTNSNGTPNVCIGSTPCGVDNVTSSPTQVAIYYFVNPDTNQGFNTAGPVNLTSGTLTPVSVAPEPSSFVLFGTGILAAAGAMRRRLRKS